MELGWTKLPNSRVIDINANSSYIGHGGETYGFSSL